MDSGERLTASLGTSHNRFSHFSIPILALYSVYTVHIQYIYVDRFFNNSEGSPLKLKNTVARYLRPRFSLSIHSNLIYRLNFCSRSIWLQMRTDFCYIHRLTSSLDLYCEYFCELPSTCKKRRLGSLFGRIGFLNRKNGFLSRDKWLS